jgi:hypothetical protein
MSQGNARAAAAANPPAFSTDDTAVLLQLAAAAMGDLSVGPILPAGWSPLATLPAAPPAPARSAAQGYYATGTLPSSDATPIAVLALGVPWVAYLNQVQFGVPTLVDLPPDVRPRGETAKVIDAFANLYGGRRGDIWSNLARIGGASLVIVGMGLGAPLAQIAAIDLRPGASGPQREAAPQAQPACVVFSAPAFGDAGFAALFGRTVPSGQSVGLARVGAPLDRFPMPQGLVPGVVAAGMPQVFPALLPRSGDDPWLERSPDFYLAALGGSPSPPPAAPFDLAPLPPGFEPLLAWSLAQLCQLPYQLARQPGLLLPDAPAPLQLLGVVQSNGVALAAVLAAAGGTVVAFRGTIGFEEFIGILANSAVAIAHFIADEGAYVHCGALGVYTGGTGGQGTVQSALLSLLQAVAPQRLPIYCAGHDLGGALAVLAAADIARNASGLGTPIVYTFGSVPVGSFSLAPLLADLNLSIYAVARPADFLARAAMKGGYGPVGTAIALRGTPPLDEPGAHALGGYAALLSPWA